MSDFNFEENCIYKQMNNGTWVKGKRFPDDLIAHELFDLVQKFCRQKDKAYSEREALSAENERLRNINKELISAAGIFQHALHNAQFDFEKAVDAALNETE